MGADQLVPCVCQDFGSLHDEQQETLASVCCTTLPNNNMEPKSLLVFHTTYLHAATSAHTWIWFRGRSDGAFFFFFLCLIHIPFAFEFGGCVIGQGQLKQPDLFVKIFSTAQVEYISFHSRLDNLFLAKGHHNLFNWPLPLSCTTKTKPCDDLFLLYQIKKKTLHLFLWQGCVYSRYVLPRATETSGVYGSTQEGIKARHCLLWWHVLRQTFSHKL